jgi:amino acid adenylation domain-containing protein
MIRNILTYLENSAARVPDKIAFADVDTDCTYAELLENAKRIGSALARSSEKRLPVAVFMNKSVSAVTTFLGITYAGCFYVLLDPAQPAARLRSVLDTIEASVLITERENLDAVSDLEFDGTISVYEDILAEEKDELILADVRKQATDTDPLYAVFTSGSTGAPKGILVGHRSVIDYTEAFSAAFGIREDDVIGNQAPFDFDVSASDMYTTLRAGATMQIIPTKYFSLPAKVLDFLCDRNITVIDWAVSALCLITALKGFRYRVPDGLRLICFTGEVMPTKHLGEWMRNIPDAVYANCYGPSEVTVYCTFHIVEQIPEENIFVPIGAPFQNERVFLLDESDRLVIEPGVKGEICVAGTALSIGYFGAPELTAKAFVQNPVNTKYPETIYRTGDLGYYNGEGLLFFHSRKDFQIKHKGHRVELPEIDLAIGAISGVERVCCVHDGARDKIAAFYSGEIETDDVARELREVLPSFMVPDAFFKLDALPLNKNGKTDRASLLERFHTR